MTQTDSGPGGADALSTPFTPGMRDNPAELTDYTDGIVGRPLPIADGESPTQTPEQEFAAEWRNAAYNCFSSGHKFCR